MRLSRSSVAEQALDLLPRAVSTSSRRVVVAEHAAARSTAASISIPSRSRMHAAIVPPGFTMRRISSDAGGGVLMKETTSCASEASKVVVGPGSDSAGATCASTPGTARAATRRTAATDPRPRHGLHALTSSPGQSAGPCTDVGDARAGQRRRRSRRTRCKPARVPAHERVVRRIGNEHRHSASLQTQAILALREQRCSSPVNDSSPAVRPRGDRAGCRLRDSPAPGAGRVGPARSRTESTRPASDVHEHEGGAGERERRRLTKLRISGAEGTPSKPIQAARAVRHSAQWMDTVFLR